MAYTHSDLQGALSLLTTGKVRDLYEVDSSTLLFVATDRISAYDVIMENGIPNKGIILNQLTAYWFRVLEAAIPTLRTHFITLTLPASLPPPIQSPLQNRSMLVRRLKIFPIEAIVRGYLSGSAWTEYSRSGTVHGLSLPPSLRESEAIPSGPIYTPSTKAAPGSHDENISIARAAEIIGSAHATRIERLALLIYTTAAAYAWHRGLIIADTKFEFGLDVVTDEIVLVDEVLTPDSSRFWPREGYEVGKSQDSFDKQFLRDWLVGEGLKGKAGTVVPEEIVNKTSEKYSDVYEILTGRSWAEGLDGEES